MKNAIVLNLTQHTATSTQKEAGVYEPVNKEVIQQWLTFDKVPTKLDIKLAAATLANHAAKEVLETINIDEYNIVAKKLYDLIQHGKKFQRDFLSLINAQVMIGGAPFLMPQLEVELRKQGLTPVYAFSERKVTEIVNEKGEVSKRAVFEHKGFIEAVIVE